MWRGKTLVAACVLALAGCGDGDGGPQTTDAEELPADAVAVVDGESIPRELFEGVVRGSLRGKEHGRVLADEYPDAVACGIRLQREDPEAFPADSDGGQVPVDYCRRAFDRIRSDVMMVLLEGVFAERSADELGVHVTAADARRALARVSDDRSFAPYLSNDQTRRLARRGMVIRRVQRALRKSVAQPIDADAIRRHYRQHRDEYQVSARRRIRFLVAARRPAAVEARHDLEAGVSWPRVVVEHAQEGSSRQLAGKSVVFRRTALPEEVASVLFDAPLRTLVGPKRIPTGWIVFEVLSEAPARTQTLDEARRRVVAELKAANASRGEAAVAEYRARWRERTRCHQDILVAVCSNGPELPAPETDAGGGS